MVTATKESAARMFAQLVANIIEREAEGIFLCPGDRAVRYFDPGYNVDHMDTDPGPTLSLEAYQALIGYIKDRWKMDPAAVSINFHNSFVHHDMDGEHTFLLTFLKDSEGEGFNIRRENPK